MPVPKYKNVQFSYSILILFIITFLLVIYPLTDAANLYLPALLLIIIFIIFHKLTITLNDSKISAYFGFGFFKKEMSIADIDITSIQMIKVNWWTGLGIRITNYGWLYNVNFGSALLLKSKDKRKTFFVGTADFENLRQILIEAIDKENVL